MRISSIFYRFILILSMFLPSFIFADNNVYAKNNFEILGNDGYFNQLSNELSANHTIKGNTISISVADGEIKVTPHTITSSGWVIVEYLSKNLTGDVDISFGFDGKYDIKPTLTEKWLSYTHNKTRVNDIVLDGTFKPSKINSMSIIKESDMDSKIRLLSGDIKLNDNIAYIEYVDNNIKFGNNTFNGYVAYSDFDTKTSTFSYKFNGKVNENYTETYEDWLRSTNAVSKSSDVLLGSTNWNSIKIPSVVTKNTWNKIRFWVDVPFKGFEGVSGKYNIAIKPSGVSITQAKANGNLLLLDPWYDSDWLYRKEITVTNAVASYQSKIIVGYDSSSIGEDVDCNGNCETTFNDLRFTGSDESTLLDYWVESTNSTYTATVWVQNDATPSSTIYMYYGNSGASDASNGANTFLFFDDFNRADSTTVGGGWTEADANVGSIDTNNLELLTSGAQINNAIYQAYTWSGKTQTYSSIKSTSATSDLVLSAEGSAASSIRMVGPGGASTGSGKDQYICSAVWQDLGTTFTTSTYGVYGIKHDNVAATFSVSKNYSDKYTGLSYYAASFFSASIYFWSYFGGQTAYIDWVHVGLWATTEPSFSYGDEESGTNAPTVITISATNITGTSATFNGNITATTVGDTLNRGFSWGTTSNATSPVGEKPPASYTYSNITVGNYTEGVFYDDRINLTTGTTYYYRAAANNSVGWGWGSEKSFTTLILTIQTNNADNITATSATGYGNITVITSNVTQRGVAWGVVSNTTTPSRNQSAPATYTSNKTLSGSWVTGVFSSNITGLTSSSIYYYRAYAYDGTNWAWGEEKSIETSFSLAAWTYYKEITILHSGDGAQTDYPVKILVGESSGATGEDVDCDSHVATDFDDLLFTSSNNSIIYDYWIESITGSTPNQLSTVWVKIPTIPAHPDNTTLNMYYGNAFTGARSNGAKVFGDTNFDDFEWGDDGDLLSVSGGNITWGVVESPSIETDQYFRGSRSGRVQSAATAYVSKALSTNLALRYWVRIPTSPVSYFSSRISDGDSLTYAVVWPDLTLQYYDYLVWTNTGYSATADTWQLHEISSVDFFNYTYDWTFGSNKIDAVIGSANVPSFANTWRFSTEGDGNGAWIDNVVFRKFTPNEPDFGGSGDEVNAQTYDITNTPSSKSFGIIAANSANYAKGTAPNNPVVDGDCTFSVTNDGNVPIDISIHGHDFDGGVGWTLVSDYPSTLSDTFSDNSFDTDKFIESTNAGSLVAEQNNRLELISAAAVSAFVRSNNTYQLAETQTIIKVLQSSTDGGFKFCPTLVAGHEWDVYSENDWYNFQEVSGGNVSVVRKKSGAATTLATTSSPLTEPYWLRMRVTGGSIYFEYADNQTTKPNEYGWTELTHEAWDLGVPLTTSEYIYLTAYNTGTTGEQYVSNFEHGTISSLGDDNVKLTAYYSGQVLKNAVILDTTGKAFISDVSSTNTVKWDFKLLSGSFTDGVKKTSKITLTGTVH